jgi:hypothetical protein
MAFPTLRPTARNYEPGDWPVKTYNALSGAEIRIRYGNQRTNAKLALSYDNIRDTDAEAFLTHYKETEGTFRTFSLPTQAATGWQGSSTAFSPGGTNAAYRYASAPKVTAVRPGISSITVDLVGVLP